MAEKRLYIGSLGPFFFDDTDVYPTPQDAGDQGFGDGVLMNTLVTDGAILVGSFKLWDTDTTHSLEIKWNEDDSADRILNFLVGGGNRSLTLNEDFTIGDGYNVTITALGQANTLTLNESLTIGDGNSGTITFGSASDVLTINETLTLSGASGKTLTLTENLTIGDGTDITITGVTQANTLTLYESLTLGDGHSGTLTYSAASKVLTVDESASISDFVRETDFNADTFLYATNNNTPVATSPANVMAALSGHAGAAFNFGGQALTDIADIDLLRTTVGDIGVQIQNTDNTTATSDARVLISSGGANAGDPYVGYTISGVMNWYTGTDNDDSDKFKISTSRWGDIFTLQTDGNAGFGTASPGARVHARRIATTDAFPLEVMRLEVVDPNSYGGNDVDMVVGMGPKLVFYMPHNTVPFEGAYIAAEKETASDNEESTGLAFATTPDAGSATERMRIDADGSIDIIAHDGATVGLKLGGVLITKTAAEINAL